LNDKIAGGDIGTGSDNWISHGTHVAGIAAGESNNGQGVSGVDWNARIHPQRIDLGGDAETYQAIVDAVNYSPNVFVLNNSYGLMFDENTPGRYSTTVRQAVAYAYKNNRIFVASMGNHQDTHPGIVNYPAGYPNTIAVGSTDRNDVIAGSSVHGAYIDVCAPGVGIYSTITGSAYGYMSGTSMAAPHAAGLASLLKGYKTNLANDDVMNIIRLSADKVPEMNEQNFTNAYGFGRINAERALNYLKAPYLLVQATATGGTVTNTSETYKQQFIGANGLTGVYLVKRIEVRKTIPLPDNIYGIVGIWGRGAFSTGWNHENPIFGEGFCEVVPGSQTGTSVTLRTFTYQVYNLAGQYFGYYPQSPSNMTFAYSVLGLEAPSISGPSVVCDEATYTIENLPAGATVQWSAGNNNLQLVSGQDSTAVFRKNGNGNCEINASITMGTNSIPLTSQRVWTGNPQILSINGMSPGQTFKGGRKVTFSVNPDTVQGVTSYYWGGANCQIINGQGTSSVQVKIDNNPYTEELPFNISVTYHNLCGQGILRQEGYILPLPKPASFTLSPNPATDMVTVRLEEETAEAVSGLGARKAVPPDVIEIQLWSAVALLRAYKTDQSAYQISVSDLPKGMYFVRVIKNGKIHTQKLLKN
uniref:S8 family serine peptidase n=1 Tax=Prevotella heparinolytica TaxID=28113 RepID=UPI00359FD05C